MDVVGKFEVVATQEQWVYDQCLLESIRRSGAPEGILFMDVVGKFEVVATQERWVYDQCLLESIRRSGGTQGDTLYGCGREV